MGISATQQQLLRRLPGVDRLLAKAEGEPDCAGIPKSLLLKALRETLDQQRNIILSNADRREDISVSEDELLAKALAKASRLQAPNLKRVINATGIVVHTNLGRSCLAPEVISQVAVIAGRYSNLEFDLDQGRRGSRHNIVEELLCELTGAEAAMVVNNNAAAVLLCLDTLAHGKEVIISRGELVEIGGSFRIPDVMTKSGAILKEVGTTNRTHLYDYETAIGPDTGLLLKVHTSNYHIEGFTSAVPLKALVALGNRRNQPVMEDLGSGNLIDLRNYGLHPEPTVQDSVAAGADVITFSGDKLLGGPQGGFIIGSAAIIERLKKNPLARALRIDKLTLAATEATLQLYRDIPTAVGKIPTARMLTMKKPEIEKRAQALKKQLESLNNPRLSVALYDLPSKAGGGALPLLELPSCCVGIKVKGTSVNTLEKRLREYTPPIIGRIENDRYIMDPRTLQQDELETVVGAVDTILRHFAD